MSISQREIPLGIVSNPLLNFLVNPKLKYYRHLIPILLLLLLLQTGEAEYKSNTGVLIAITLFISFIGVLYFNMYVLVPELLFRGRHVRYFITVILLTLITFFLLGIADDFLQQHRIMPKKEAGSLWEGLFAYTLVFSIVISASTAIKLFQRWVVDSYLINELEKTKLRSELGQLKSQINPHFLFNMLNNAQVLMHRDAQKASQVLIKLSDLLRYQLYDSAREKVLLISEIHFLTDLLELEKIRRDNFEYIVSREGDISSIRIPPFLFVIFVENAMKHNVDTRNPSYVQLSFEITRASLFFKCINSKPEHKYSQIHSGGIGLANVRRRLELLYPGRHSIDILEDPKEYAVTLAIPL